MGAASYGSRMLPPMGRRLLTLLYWAAVLAVSLVLLVLLVMFFESRDQSGVGSIPAIRPL